MGLVAGSGVELRNVKPMPLKEAPRTSALVKSAHRQVGTTQVRAGQVLASEVRAAKLCCGTIMPLKSRSL